MPSCYIAFSYLIAVLVHPNAQHVKVIPYAAKMPKPICQAYLDKKAGRDFLADYWIKGTRHTRQFHQWFERCTPCSAVWQSSPDRRSQILKTLSKRAEHYRSVIERKLSVHAFDAREEFPNLPRWQKARDEDYTLSGDLEFRGAWLVHFPNKTNNGR